MTFTGCTADDEATSAASTSTSSAENPTSDGTRTAETSRITEPSVSTPGSASPDISDGRSPTDTAATTDSEWTRLRCPEPHENGDFECGVVDVPFDHDMPGRGRLDIAVARLPAESGDPDGVIVLNPGGPGGSGVDLLFEHGPDLVERLRLERFDLVSFDPRGVARSREIRCVESPRNVDRIYIDLTPDDDAELAAWEFGPRQFAQQCLQDYGELLALYDTEGAARDMDLIRAALGVERITPLMMSYGTFLAATYATLFPNRVDAMVLDAPFEPLSDELPWPVTQAIATERALDRWAAWCTSTSTCELGDRDPLAVWDQVDQMLEAGATTSDGEAVGVSRLITATRSALILGDEPTWGSLASALDASVGGRHDDLVALSNSLDDLDDDAEQIRTSDANAVILCASGLGAGRVALDDAVSISVLAARAPRMGPLFVTPIDPCETITPDAAAVPLRPVDVPVLVIDSVGDIATPPVWADEMMALYGSVARRVTYEGEGHVKVGASECVDAVVAAFLDDPASIPVLTTCEAGT